MKKDLLRNLFSQRQMFFLLIMLLSTSLFLFMPVFSGLFDSYFSFVILVFSSFIVIFLSNSLSEFASMFTHTSGGFFVYLSKAYNRWVGFVVSSSLLLGSYLISLYFLFSIYSKLFLSTFISLALTCFTILVVHYLIHIFKKKSSILLMVSLSIPFFSLIIITFVSAINFSLTLPVFIWSFPSWSLISALVISVASISYFLISLLYGELGDAEEVVHEHTSKSYLVFFILIIFSLFFFTGSTFSTGLFVSFSRLFYSNWLFQSFTILSIISFCVFAWFALLRLLVTFSKEKLFFLKIGFLDKNNSPVNAIIIQSLILIFLSFILVFIPDLSFKVLLFFLLFLLISSLLLVFGVFVLRKRFPDIERPYTVKYPAFSSFLFLLFSSGIIFLFLFFVMKVNLSFLLIFSLIFFLLSLFYFAFEYYYNESTFSLVNSLTCYCSFLQRFRAGLFSKKFLLSHLPNISGLRVLEFGAHSGLFTDKLLSRIGKGGKLFVTDQSKRCVSVLSKRFFSKKKFSDSIVFLKDYFSSIHPSVSKIQFFFSVGMFWHLNHLDFVLQQLNIVMLSDSLLFISTPSRFLGFPLKFWNDDSTIKKYFSDEGFTIIIYHYSSFFVSHVLIIGVRDENVELLSSWYSPK